MSNTYPDIIAKFTHPDYGYTWQQEEAKKLLTIGEEYRVKSVNMGQSYTDVWLVGINRAFNSVLFDFYDNGREVELRDYPEFNPYYGIR